ncbi:putative lipid scramblase CLPTM1 [Phaenicophaeus curvirostris]|uniref:putative lipid scramblase CLPTM1 n=1 Tax=Phaenicophaeus curvirostris TaxID=33595 RepID=UPI0037F0BC53
MAAAPSPRLVPGEASESDSEPEWGEGRGLSAAAAPPAGLKVPGEASESDEDDEEEGTRWRREEEEEGETRWRREKGEGTRWRSEKEEKTRWRNEEDEETRWRSEKEGETSWRRRKGEAARGRLEPKGPSLLQQRLGRGSWRLRGAVASVLREGYGAAARGLGALGAVLGRAQAGAAAAAGAETQRQQPPPNAWQVLKGVLFRIFIIWAISSWFRRGPAPQEQSSAGGTPRAPSRNLFPKDTLMDLYVYISEHEHFTDFNVSSALFWQKRDLVYGDWTSGDNADGCYEHYGEVDISQSVQQNGSIYIHVYFTKSGFHPDPRQKNLYRRLATVHTSRMINKYKRRRFQKTKNLLTGETEADPEMIKRAEDYGPVEVISHWHPNLTINMVDDHTPWVKGSVPPPLDQYVKFDAISGDYYPILYFNDYWNLQKDYFPINETLQRLPFRLSFCPLSLWRWQLYAAQSTKSPWNFLGEGLYEQSDEEQDSVKVALLETNPYLLALTIVVSIVHSIFEFLAFKNDIQFWNSRQSLEGLSVRSVFFGVFQSLVVLLYILDNETNFVVQVSVFIGLLIDLWKITKVMDVRLDRHNKVAGIFPRVTFKDKSTYVESSTKVYDDMAFRYLSWILFPLLGCYAVYSLLYLEHKGWYSWVLSMLYGFLLTFGFITMTPQLFINYKLKSVAHLPWRMLTYKALNTFIDDLFAFVIKMPMMYRIGCLRDDVVFFIYLYQRWIYRVDLTRVNEFGVRGEAQAPPLPPSRPPCPPATPDRDPRHHENLHKDPEDKKKD